jgi:hypothetical protein
MGWGGQGGSREGSVHFANLAQDLTMPLGANPVEQALPAGPGGSVAGFGGFQLFASAWSIASFNASSR